MNDNRRGNLAALIALAAILLAAGLMFGPGLYRSWLFERSCSAMLADAESGNLQSVSGYVLQEQQKKVGALFQTVVPADYTSYMESLKLSSFSREEGNPNVIWSVVTARFSYSGEGAGLAQGKLRWVWQGGEWRWDFDGSYGAHFPTSGEANWVKLGDFITIESVD